MVAPAKPNPIQLQKLLKGMAYPASKGELVRHAEDNGADETVLEAFAPGRIVGTTVRTW
jgi:hypothetical protein